MTTILSMKKRIFLLLMATMMLCMANVLLFAAVIIPDGVIIEENLGSEDELMPMAAARCATSWYNDDGSKNYPPNYGFAGSYTIVTLPAGTQLGHYGDASNYYCDLGASASGLALPPWNTGIYSVYTLTKNTQFYYGIVADWGGSTGGGYQYYQID